MSDKSNLKVGTKIRFYTMHELEKIDTLHIDCDRTHISFRTIDHWGWVEPEVLGKVFTISRVVNVYKSEKLGYVMNLPGKKWHIYDPTYFYIDNKKEMQIE